MRTGKLAANFARQRTAGLTLAFVLHGVIFAAATYSHSNGRIVGVADSPITVSLLPSEPITSTPAPKIKLVVPTQIDPQPIIMLTLLAEPAETPAPLVASQSATRELTASEPTSSVVPPRFDAAYLQNPPPVYPALARRMREQGLVLLRVLVTTAGEPERIELNASSGAPRLDQAAVTAVKRWRFVPARQGNQPVAAWVVVPISFSLEV